jgi:dihydrofolate synthase / folylpolyglutamate synthase
MTYPETLAHLYSLARFGIKPGLERITALLEAVGNPHHGLKSVHIAGTNGKGSTAAFLSAIVAAGGYRVGLFTSPHLIHFTERMQINGVRVSEEKVVSLLETVMRGAPPEATFFEIVTAMSLLWFAEEQVDLVVLEAGMGGRLDATGVVSGMLSVVTPISLDHCEYLGNSIAAIAAEKAGVAKQGTPIVVSPQDPEVLEVLLRCSVEQNNGLYLSGRDFTMAWEDGGLFYRGLDRTLAGMKPGIPGRYQAANAASALCAAELLAKSGFALDDATLARGIETARWPGRMELFGSSPRILLDGAHNTAGAAALAEALQEISRSRLILVVGVMGDKDAAGILAWLLPLADMVVAVTPNIAKALPSSDLVLLCRNFGVACLDAGTAAKGLDLARMNAETDDLVLVCGSLYLVGEARALLLSERFEPLRG